MTDTVNTLNRIYAAIDYMSNLENQDTMMTLEMSQQMISDVINTGEIKPMIDYVKRYCDVIDGPEDAQRIADEIVSDDETGDVACETHLIIDCDAEECQPEHTETGDLQ
jgi:hypothetical protein